MKESGVLVGTFYSTKSHARENRKKRNRCTLAIDFLFLFWRLLFILILPFPLACYLRGGEGKVVHVLVTGILVEKGNAIRTAVLSGQLT